MNQSRPGQQRQIMQDQRGDQAPGRAEARESRGFAQIPNVKRETRQVQQHSRQYIGVHHRAESFTGHGFPAHREYPSGRQHYSQFPNWKARGHPLRRVFIWKYRSGGEESLCDPNTERFVVIRRDGLRRAPLRSSGHSVSCLSDFTTEGTGNTVTERFGFRRIQ
jgi:hypothetical protein